MFAQNALGGRLFDLNTSGTLDVLLAQNFTFARGLFRGNRLLNVLETLLSRSTLPRVKALCSLSPQKAAPALIKLLQQQARKPRDRSLYANQIHFGEL